MERVDENHLSRIATLWTVVNRAHQEAATQARSAQEQLLERYGNAIRRYLQAALGQADAVDEVFQRFAQTLVGGGLKGADPDRGRFRDYVKTTLYHLLAQFHRERRRQPLQLASNSPEQAVEPSTLLAADREFLGSWRHDLLARCWEALGAVEKETGQLYYTVLRLQADHPELHSPALAERLGAQLGRALTAAGVRQTLHRARKKFAALLLDEVAHSLDNPSEDDVLQELIDLELLRYCQDALPQRQASYRDRQP